MRAKPMMTMTLLATCALAGSIGLGQIEKEIPVGRLTLAQGWLLGHVDRFPPDLALIFDWAGLHAQSAAGAILGRYLECVLLARELLPPRVR